MSGCRELGRKGTGVIEQAVVKEGEDPVYLGPRLPLNENKLSFSLALLRRQLELRVVRG